jgi:hypothetical protein
MKRIAKSAVAVLFLLSSSFACGEFSSPTAPGSGSPPPAGSAVDLGNPADEALHNLQGWGEVNQDVSFPPEPNADRTARYQLVRLSNSLELLVPQAGTPYTLVFRTQDGTCDDSFDLYVNGKGPLYSYRHRTSIDRFPVHRVPIAASVVTTTSVHVNFVNVAVDNCGLAAVYYVRVD